MKVVINRCYGGFSISPLAVERLMELQGRKCYPFEGKYEKNGSCTWTPVKKSDRYPMSMFVHFADIPDFGEQYVALIKKPWGEMTSEESRAANEFCEKHGQDIRPDDRTDPLLIQVVEELGEKANGMCAELKIVEIPDGVNYEIAEYDGMETVRERSRQWS